MSSIPPWEDPRKVLARHGLAPKRGFSQNFLVSQSVAEAIANALEIEEGETVVELGSGAGALTGALLRHGASVIGVERDRDMARVLRAEFGATPAFQVLEADAATIDLGDEIFPERVALAGNLPYAITGKILRRLVEERAHISRAVVMIQREVRDRLLASPTTKSYGALTVFVSACYAVESVIHVPPGAFFPPPKVRSSVLRLRPLETPRAIETEAFRAVVKAAFGARRKTLLNALTQIGDRQRASEALMAAGIAGERRGETLSVEELAELALAWEKTSSAL